MRVEDLRARLLALNAKTGGKLPSAEAWPTSELGNIVCTLLVACEQMAQRIERLEKQVYGEVRRTDQE